MHSAEHILNQTMVRTFGCGRSFSAHIEKKKSKCDYHFDRSLGDEEIRTIESNVNEVIGRDLPVIEEFLTRDEAARLYSLVKLPESAGERIRIVKVGDYDACPCIGEHVGSTKEIGEFRITSSSHQDSVLRIRFKIMERK
jgi:Ser-tRNA(Ala) deacylase AlaX